MMELVDRAVAQLAEHFTTVQIFAARYRENSDTEAYRSGAGDLYSRIGQAREWLIRLEEETRLHVRKHTES